ncbi:hypothetical protein FF011L_44270 [Roseimaritima multifibrata]|uniref:DUF8091 domain-containing protein n=1 Tax=Roseimaritima multifibrata TaxID=1930274 RepID=A0A517ML78_9BACT|nr:hypothetical protein [Roseimaritima multifibrata]QDS95629.1 hypothetical protein FF011L_44270 [Roseimaritima multifibrata]
METSLHRQLKQSYALHAADVEVTLGPYRIDAIRDGELIEIQHGSLVSIRDKIGQLLQTHSVRVVKPIIYRKRIVKQKTADGKVLSRRFSPSRGTVLEIFDELIYFTKVFPHPQLILEVPLVEVEEWRLPPKANRRRRRKATFRVKDVVLTGIESTHQIVDSFQLLDLLGIDFQQVPDPFNTEDLAKALDVKRWIAQRIAYVLRETAAIKEVGKTGNTFLYTCMPADEDHAAA